MIVYFLEWVVCQVITVPWLTLGFSLSLFLGVSLSLSLSLSLSPSLSLSLPPPPPLSLSLSLLIRQLWVFGVFIHTFVPVLLSVSQPPHWLSTPYLWFLFPLSVVLLWCCFPLLHISFSNRDNFSGLMVKASTSVRGGTGFEPWQCHIDTLEIGILVALKCLA